MNEIVSVLLVVQDRDSKILALQQELKHIPAEKQRISQYREQRKAGMTKAKKEVQDTEIAIKNLELDAESRRANIRKLKTQMMETRKNDEYQAFGREISRLEGDVDELETQELGMMEHLDTARINLKKAEEKYQEVAKTIDNDLLSLEERMTNLTAQLKQLEEERLELVKPLDEGLMQRYDRMKNNKGLPVVVLLTESAQCAGCHTKVIRSTESKVMEGREVVECENCGRILH